MIYIVYLLDSNEIWRNCEEIMKMQLVCITLSMGTEKGVRPQEHTPSVHTISTIRYR